MSLIYFSVAWMVGIYVASQWALPLAMWGLAALVPASVAWVWRRDARARLAALCGLFMLLGAMRYVVALPRFDERSVSTYNDQGSSTLVGVVIAEPDVRDTYVNLRLRAERLSLEDGGTIEVKGLVLVRAPRYPERFYGERLRVLGRLDTPPVFETFSYRDYLARSGIHSIVQWAWIEVLERGQGNPLFSRMLSFKRYTQRVIANILPEPCASLLSGILLGLDHGLPADLAAAFRTTGTSHIIAISGFNLAIVSGFVSRLAVRLVGRRYAAWFSTAAIAVYTLFVGASAAVVRAAVMGSIAVWGQHLGRQNSSPNALFATALLMTAWNPHTLWDLGFLLSFTATLGLIALADPLQKRFVGMVADVLPARWVEPVGRVLNESFVLTVCAQLTTLPVIIYHMRSLSLVTLLSNVLILPAQQQVMVWGAVATLGGLLWLPLGRVLGWVAWLFLGYTIWTVEWTADLPHAEIELGSVRLGVVWAWYALLGAGAWWMAQTAEKRKAVWKRLRQGVARLLPGRLPAKAILGGLATVAVLMGLAIASLPDGRLHVTFLDVGEGDAVWIETPLGQQILIDGGPSPSKIAAHLGRKMPFWDRSLDLVVLTDLTDEHLMGLIPVLERYEVGYVFYPQQECTRATCARLQEVMREKGLAGQQPIAGTTVDVGRGVMLTVLHPSGHPRGGGGVPIVLRVDYGQTCVLLAGGADRGAEAEMLGRGEHVRCDVLQVGGRGGEEATGAAFLEAVRPAFAVISRGDGGGNSQALDETLARLAQHGATVARTDLHGGVEVISDGVGYEVKVGR